MQNKGLISIIITCYNQEKYISKAIQSIIDQTYTNWECIVVDDGSTDGSKDVIENSIKDDARFHLYKIENGGVSKARNYGFQKAEGEYIQFLDGDDWFTSNKLEKQHTYLKNNLDIDVCYAKHSYYFDKSNSYKEFEFEALSTEPLHQFIYKWHAEVAIPTHAFLYRRRIWTQDELPYVSDYNKREEDWIFNILTAMKNIKYGFINEVLCIYFIGKNNFTSSMLNSCVHTIDAALYIKKLLLPEEQEHFWVTILKKTFNRYYESRKNEVLYASKNWRIGNALSKPFFLLIKKFKSILN